MSAFIVGHDCINRAVLGLSLVNFPHGNATETELGRKLLTLNIEAVTQRYPDTVENPNNLPGPCDDNGNSTAWHSALTYEYDGTRPIDGCTPAVAAWKALQCLIYQCSEGNIPERELFKQIELYAEKLGRKILSRRGRYTSIYDMPECSLAPWGD